MAKIFELKSAEYVDVKAVAGSALTAGTPMNQENCAGFPLTDVDNGDEYTLVIKAPKVRAAKEASLVVVAGDKLYYDLSATAVTTTSSDNVAVGYALDASAAAETDVLMYFDGMGINLA